MKSIQVIEVNNKVEAWASTKAAVVEVANAAAKAWAQAYRTIIEQCGQHVNDVIEVKVGRTFCELRRDGAARINRENPDWGYLIDSDTVRQHWRFTVEEWQELAKELQRYTSVELCYSMLVERL